MDMFARKTTYGGGFNATSAKIIFSGFKSGLAFETVGVSYQQQIVRIWDLDGESGNVYLAAGHPSGNANVSKAVGPRRVAMAFYERYADVCRAAENTLTLAATTGCISNTGANRSYGGNLRIALSGVVISAVSVSVNANDPIIRQQLGMTFIALDWTEADS